MQITDGNSVEFFADDVLLITAGLARLVLEPNAGFLRELRAEIERRGAQVVASFRRSSIDMRVNLEIKMRFAAVGTLSPCTHSQTVGCETPIFSASSA
jgi:hypothetical protein